MEKRCVPGQSMGLHGFCHLEGESAWGWRDCQVVDISDSGIGLAFHYGGEFNLVGRGISIDLPAGGDKISLWLQGEVKHCTTRRDGTIRAGVQFAGLSADEVSIVRALGSLRPAS